ncbi:MAG TPA: alpha/beta hydrolase [Actinomycetota bacterium]|nr:alpha/beta hydrolase [Actinomycetota bacterium]
MTKRRVEFPSDGVRIVGDFRLPDGDGPHPALVFTGPFTGVKEQVVGNYAQRLTQAGFVTLAFDHRNFGESEGTPRQHEDPQGKLNDLRDAVSHLATLPEVDPDRIGAVGICLGGGYALKFAAFDPRVKAVVLVAGGYNDPRQMRQGMGPDGYRQQLANFAQVGQRQHATGQVEYMAAVAPEGEPAVMGGQEPYDYYGTERSASPHWQNRISTLSIRELITLDTASAAEFISPTPMLVVHGRTDAYCSPEGAQSVFDRAGDPKEIMWLNTSNHIDLYDVEQFVAPASARAADWFRTHL